MNAAAIIALCTGLPTVIAALAAAVVTVLNGNKIAEVHVLVNNRLDEALEEIESLKGALAVAKGD